MTTTEPFRLLDPGMLALLERCIATQRPLFKGVGVDGTSGKGSTFWFELPLRATA